MYFDEEENNDELIPIVSGDTSYKQRGQILHGGDKKYLLSPQSVRSNFNAMCLSFSLNHSCVVACLAYASAELGDDLSSVCGGILYVCFALTAFLVSNPLVIAIGWKNGLMIGTFGYCVYVCGFLMSVIFLEYAFTLSWIIACSAAAVGGLAGGLLWTAQGRCFSQHASIYSSTTGLPIDKVTTDFAALFAAYFLGFEMAAKLLATMIYLSMPEEAPYLVFSAYTLLAVGSCLYTSTLEHFDDLGTWEISYKIVSRNVGAAGRLIYADSRLIYLIPFQVAYGAGSSMVAYYVMGTVIAKSPQLGKQYVGLMAAVVVLSGAVTSIPLAKIANSMGKNTVISIGNICFIATSLIFFLLSNEQMGTWMIIVPYCIIFGIGRGVWENANKAVIADFFAADSAACTTAFSATAFFTGYSGALGFFCFRALTRLDMAGVVLLAAIASSASYELAFGRDRQIRADQEFASHKMEIIRQRFEECKRAREGRLAPVSIARGLGETKPQESFLL